MKFKKRTKEKLRSKLYPILDWARLGQLPESYSEKAWNIYIRFLEIFFTIVTSLTFTIALAWFFPIYLGRGYELSIVILLCIIALELRYGTLTIKFEGEE